MNTAAHSAPRKILITDRFDVSALALLKGNPRMSVGISETPTPTNEELEGIDGLIIRSRTKITSDFLARASQLKMIVTATSGFDHIDFEATREHGLVVMHTPEANAASACELTWGLVLACARRIPDAHRSVKNGDWRRESLVGRELSGKTYGIVGLGRIGTRVARVARAFGMKLIAFDPYKDEPHFEAEGATRVSMEELLKLADVISFHVPATAETEHMITLANLEYLNRGAIVVNTSRGSVMKESDLVTALENGWIGACGLDVFEREPLPRQSALMNLKNVVLSPHLGATTTEAFAAASREAAEKAIAYFTSGKISDELPPKETWYESGFAKPPFGPV